jgi:uncharacterized membrane protein
VELTDTGKARLNGYLFVLERSLRSFLPADVMRDSLREVESHLRDRIATAAAAPDERTSLEKILTEFGTPLRVAQAYSHERTIDEAVTTGRVVPMLRAIWQMSLSTLAGFGIASALFTGYMAGVAFLAIAVLKPIFPANVGVEMVNGMPLALGARFPLPPGVTMSGGYWVIPVALTCGLAILVGTHRGARKLLARWKRQVRPPTGA